MTRNLSARYPVIVARFTEGRVPMVGSGEMTAAQIARDVDDFFRYCCVAPDTVKIMSDSGQVLGVASLVLPLGRSRDQFRDNSPVPFIFVPVRYPGMRPSDKELADELATLLPTS